MSSLSSTISRRPNKVAQIFRSSAIVHKKLAKPFASKRNADPQRKIRGRVKKITKIRKRAEARSTKLRRSPLRMNNPLVKRRAAQNTRYDWGTVMPNISIKRRITKRISNRKWLIIINPRNQSFLRSLNG